MPEITDTQELINDLADGCKPDHERLIGLEHEKFMFSRSGRQLLRYSGVASIQSLLVEMQRFGWEPTFEWDHLTGLQMEGAAITLEPAGQLELSGKPWPDLHGVHQEMKEHRRQLSEIASEMDLAVMALGFAPEWSIEGLDWMPKSRYQIMRSYMPKVGVHGLDMMARTCALQMNFDFCSEQDMCDKYRVAMALQPLVMIAFANSPFADGRDSGFTSLRNYVWLHTDSSRCGILPAVFSSDMGFGTYVQRALDTPMYSVERKGAHVDLAGRYFADMMKGELQELPGDKPDMKDWHDHLNTLMHDVRLKGHLELRGNDTLSLPDSMALAAFWTGILYDKQSLQKALEFVRGCEIGALNQLRHCLPAVGLADAVHPDVSRVYRADSLMEALEYVAGLAEQGLKRRKKTDSHNLDESVYLEPLKRILTTGLSPAEQWRKRLHSEWGEDLGLIYEHAVF
ncbi:glutamate--cysteine ligase [Marinobacter sp.]|uniref:glutamate--cysteine ligase n=1 Tax=Marinobacter sp. TaxID=50741 RepID=UPI003850D5B9